MKLCLLNANSEFLFSADIGNLPVTYGNINEVNPLIGYQETTHNEPGNRFLKE